MNKVGKQEIKAVQQTPSPIIISTAQVFRSKLSGEENVKKLLADRLPNDFQLHAAISQGDCFFDAVGQGLNQLSGKEDCTAKSLRLLCDAYAKNIQHVWVKSAVDKDEAVTGVNYEQYLVRIQFAAQEMEENERQGLNLGAAVWGRPHIEGRMVCETFNVKLHVIEVLEESIQDNYVMEQLVDANGSRSIESMAIADYADLRTIHLVVHRNHYVPLLFKAASPLAQQSMAPYLKNSFFRGSSLNQEADAKEVQALAADQQNVSEEGQLDFK